MRLNENQYKLVNLIVVQKFYENFYDCNIIYVILYLSFCHYFI